MTWSQALWFVLSVYFQVLALGFQSRSVNSGKYVAAALTSALIGALNLVVIKTIVNANPLVLFGLTCIGGPAGVCSAMFLHARVFKTEPAVKPKHT